MVDGNPLTDDNSLLQQALLFSLTEYVFSSLIIPFYLYSSLFSAGQLDSSAFLASEDESSEGKCEKKEEEEEEITSSNLEEDHEDKHSSITNPDPGKKKLRKFLRVKRRKKSHSLNASCEKKEKGVKGFFKRKDKSHPTKRTKSAETAENSAN